MHQKPLTPEDMLKSILMQGGGWSILNTHMCGLRAAAAVLHIIAVEYLVAFAASLAQINPKRASIAVATHHKHTDFLAPLSCS